MKIARSVFFSPRNWIFTRKPNYTEKSHWNAQNTLNSHGQVIEQNSENCLHFLVKRKIRTPTSGKMPAQPQFLSDFNIIGTKMLRNELCNFWAGKCIDSKHVIFFTHPYV